MATWALAEAKAKFSEVVDKAVNHEPQEITRNGKSVAMLISMEEWQQSHQRPMKKYQSMAEFFRESPLAGSGINLTRKRVLPRKIDL